MKLFQNLFKPKWKNSDPEIRKQVLIHLDKPSHQEVFIDIATNDPSSELRLLALKRITDLDILNKIAQADSDSKINELGNKMLYQMLSGEVDGGLDNTQRQAQIIELDNQKVLEYISQKGVTPALRLAAINKVKRESLLGNLSINDNDAEIRKTAITRVTQKSTLERVFKATKTKDKVISRIAKEKLDEILRQEELPAKLLNTQKELCIKMEALGAKGLWERDKIQYDNLASQWQQLAEQQTLELHNRFEEGKIQFTKSFQNYLERHEEQLKQEAEFLPVRKEKQDIISVLNNLFASFDGEPDFTAEALKTHKTVLAEKEEQWQNTQKLPAELESELVKQFKDISRSIRAVISGFESRRECLSNLLLLEKNIDRNLKDVARLTDVGIKKLEKQLGMLGVSQLSEESLTVKSRVTSKITKANNFLKEKEQNIKRLIAEIDEKLPKLDGALTQGHLKDAISVQKNIQGKLKRLEKLDAKGLHEYKNQIAVASAKIGELNNWKSWANAPQKELLIEKVEALIGSDDDPKEIAFIVSQSRREWKKLGASEKNTSQELWDKFQDVCDKAYEPCKAFFEKESEIREQNYRGRVSFLENFEQFINITNWEAVDWKKVEQLYRQAKGEWQALGHTEHDKRKVLNKRFYAAYNTLRDKLKEMWAKNYTAKESLITEANDLENIEDLRIAISKAKELQATWKKSGRIEPSKERILWGAFKEACDKVFSRRNNENEKIEQQAAETLKYKESLCDQIEQLTQKPVAEIDAVKGELHKLWAEFKTVMVSAKDRDKALKKRVNDAIDIFERKMESFKKLERVFSLKALKERSILCEEAELAIEQSKAKEEVDRIITQLKETVKIKDSNWQERLNERIEQLSEKTDYAAILDENKAKLNMATTQLEILADIETPKDNVEERLRIQAQRLSEKLQNREEEKGAWEEFLEIEANWLCIGPVNSEYLSVLKARRVRAIMALKNSYPSELDNYI